MVGQAGRPEPSHGQQRQIAALRGAQRKQSTKRVSGEDHSALSRTGSQEGRGEAVQGGKRRPAQRCGAS